MHSSQGESQDIWKILDFAQSGSVHLEIDWAELRLKPDPPMVSEDGRNNRLPYFHTGVVSVFIDSCQNLGSKTGIKLPNPKVRVEICNVSNSTDTIIGSVDPRWEHRMNFLVCNPLTDQLDIHVIDDRSSDELIGTVHIPIQHVLEAPILSSHGLYDLEIPPGSQPQPSQLGGFSSSKIRLSVCFRYIHRPKNRGYLTHHRSLEDLSKIYHNHPTAAAGGYEESDSEGEKLLSPTAQPTAASPSVAVLPLTQNLSSRSRLRDEDRKIQLSLKYSRRTVCTMKGAMLADQGPLVSHFSKVMLLKALFY